MKFDVRNRYTGAIQFTAEIDCADNTTHASKLGFAVQWALKNGADLSGAYLSGADMRGADLIGANLSETILSFANLRGANLSGADLSGADLSGADMRRADLRGADMRGADLRGADLSYAILSGVSLRGANLSGADLSGVSLRGANLRGADLIGANLSGAKDVPALIAAQLSIVPEGPIIGWKKCSGDMIVKLSIPAEARRSNATGRKCRAEFADVLEVIGADVGVSKHDGETMYSAGRRVTCDTWGEDRWQECAGGIHFFLTREEAEAY